MSYKIQTTVEIWRDYDAEKEPLKIECNFESVEVNRARTVRDYVFLAETVADGEAKVFCRVVQPIARCGVIILVEDYNARNNQALIDKLAEAGYAVFVPDYCDRLNCGTKFPPSLSFGRLVNAKNRLFHMQKEAQDTCQYLYQKTIKRTLSFAKSFFPNDKIILMGAGLAAEIAVSVAGSDRRTDGLILLNGGIYREYLSYRRFDGQEQDPLDDHAMSWMSGVASAAYVKGVACPTLVLAATNSVRFDSDRLQTALQLFKNADVRVYLTAGGAETIGYDGYLTLVNWLANFSGDVRSPNMPDARIRYEDGVYSVYVKADGKENIAEVRIFYAFDEFDHRFRSWREGRAILISDADEYLFAVPSKDYRKAIFAYAQVRYTGGMVLSSIIYFSDEREEMSSDSATRLVLNGADGIRAFKLETDENILTEAVLTERVTSVGLKGITSDEGELVTYVLNETRAIDEDAVLQINFYTEKGKPLTLRAVELYQGEETIYTATVNVLGASGMYSAVKLEPDAFKSSELWPMESWKYVKVLYIEAKGVVIGNILFI